MNNWRLIKILAIVSGIVCIVFTVLAAYVSYKLNHTLYTSLAPASLFDYSILAALLPFLFAAILSFIVAGFSARAAKSEVEKEPEVQEKETQKPETQPGVEDVFKETPT